ncbi:kinase-like protein [Panus rudis PR-1116 ss-1]|nr:kinase-like protein [Panus rudis PR-1116 ss-1]
MDLFLVNDPSTSALQDGPQLLPCASVVAANNTAYQSIVSSSANSLLLVAILVLAIAQTKDPVHEASKCTEQEKVQIIEEIWKMLSADPHQEHRVKLRQVLKSLTLTTRHIPTCFVLAKVVYIPAGSERHHLRSGSAGYVHMCLLGRKTAVATKQFIALEDRIIAMIHSDAVAWATLRHPNVMQVLGITSISLSVPYNMPRLVMPWMENRAIIHQIRYFEDELHIEPPLSSWIRQIAMGLEYLHREGIVHGAMRSSNVMVDDDNVIKLMDYETEKHIWRHGAGFETAIEQEPIAWYTPEQYLHLNRVVEPTQEGDVYGFGCIWLHLHSRHAPYADYPYRMAILHQWGRCIGVSWPEVGLQPPHTIQELESLDVWQHVRKCLSQSPSERPRASELQQIADFDTLWIRQVYEDPISYEDLPPRYPFVPPRRYRYAKYRMRLCVQATLDAIHATYLSLTETFFKRPN